MNDQYVQKMIVGLSKAGWAEQWEYGCSKGLRETDRETDKDRQTQEQTDLPRQANSQMHVLLYPKTHSDIKTQGRTQRVSVPVSLPWAALEVNELHANHTHGWTSCQSSPWSLSYPVHIFMLMVYLTKRTFKNPWVIERQIKSQAIRLLNS